MREPSVIIHKGGRETKYEIYVEDYVISFLKRETGTFELSEFYFYGYREKGGKKYIIYGAGRDRKISFFEKYSLLEEIGCRLTQAGPIFLVKEGDDTYEIKGFEIFYQENGGMQSYLIEQKSGRGKNGQDHRTDRPYGSMPAIYKQRQREEPGDAAHSTISVQLGVILVALIAIVINSTNSYDKMQQLNQSASEVLFAIENQEAEHIEEADEGRDEIVVERDMPPEDTLQELLLQEQARSDETEEDILKLVTLENEGKAKETEEAAEDGDTASDETAPSGGEAPEGVSDDPSSAGESDAQAVADGAPSSEASGTKTASDETAQDKASENSGEEVEALSRNVARYYRVERGDTLYMISQKIYGDTTHVKKICELNQITDPDHIQSGQKIILP